MVLARGQWSLFIIFAGGVCATRYVEEAIV